MQYYLELNPAIPGEFFESSAFPRASDQLCEITTKLGLPSHFEFFSYAAQNDLCPPEQQETEIPWYEAQLGIEWLEAVSKYIQGDASSVPNAEMLLKDLAECIGVLQRAKITGAKWHFAMDI